MLEIVRRDAPWIWGYYPKSFGLHHGWVHNVEAQPDGQQHAQVPAYRPGTARSAARRMEPPGAVADLLLGAALVAVIAPAVIAGGGMKGTPPDDRLHPAPPALCDPDPDRGEPADLRAVLRRQLAGRHGANAARRQARDRRRRSNAGRSSTATTSRCCSMPRPRAGAQFTDTIFFEHSATLFAFEFGKGDDGRDIGNDISQRMGPSLAIALPVLVIGLAGQHQLRAVDRVLPGDLSRPVGRGAVRGADVDLRAVLHHRRPVFHRASCATWCRSRATTRRHRRLPGSSCCRCWSAWWRASVAARAGTAPSSWRRSARTMCAPRAPRA